MERVVKELIIHSVTIVIVLVTLYFMFTFFNSLVPIDLTKISHPLLIFMAFILTSNMLSSISDYVHEKASKALRIASIIVSAIGLIFLLKTFPYDDFYLTPLKMFVDDIVLLTIGTGITKIGGVLLGITTPMFSSVGGFIIFYSFSQILSKLPEKILNSLSPALFYSGFVFSALTIMTLMSFSKNDKVSELGLYIGRRVGRYTFYSFLILFYILSFRDVILSYASFLSKYIPFIEIGFAAFLIWTIVDGVYTHFNKEKILLIHAVREWKLHRPDIVSFKEPWFEELEKSIENFVVNGDSTKLSLRITYILARYGVPFEYVEHILEPLTEYSKEEAPIIALRWRKYKFYRERARKRINIISRVLENVKELIGQRGI